MDVQNVDVSNLCCFCLEPGNMDVNEIKTFPIPDNDYSNGADVTEIKVLTFIDLISVFKDTTDFIELYELTTKVCFSCLEQINQCYSFYQRFQKSLDKLRQLVLHIKIPTDLAEVIVPAIESQIIHEDVGLENNSSTMTFDNLVNIIQNENKKDDSEQINHEEGKISKKSTLKNKTKDKILQKNSNTSPLLGNSSLIVTQFVPKPIDEVDDFTDSDQPINRRIVTVEYKAMEVPISTKDALTTVIKNSNNSSKNEIYSCQYCRQCYSNFEYLQTHQRRTHICQFCVQVFKVTADLRQHVKIFHKIHNCAICQKTFKNHGNLRAHQRRAHDINLPAKVSLIDFMENGSGTSESFQSSLQVNQIINHDSTLESLIESDHMTLDSSRSNDIPLEIIEKEGQLMANLDLSQSTELLGMLYNPESSSIVPDKLLN